MVGVECFGGVVLPSAVLAGVVVFFEGFLAVCCCDVFVGFVVVPGHCVVMAIGLRCQPIISPLWMSVAV